MFLPHDLERISLPGARQASGKERRMCHSFWLPQQLRLHTPRDGLKIVLFIATPAVVLFIKGLARVVLFLKGPNQQPGSRVAPEHLNSARLVHIVIQWCGSQGHHHPPRPLLLLLRGLKQDGWNRRVAFPVRSRRVARLECLQLSSALPVLFHFVGKKAELRSSSVWTTLRAREASTQRGQN